MIILIIKEETEEQCIYINVCQGIVLTLPDTLHSVLLSYVNDIHLTLKVLINCLFSLIL